MLRHAAEKDVPAILEIYRFYIENTAYTFEYEVPTEAQFLARFRDITTRGPWLVWEEDGEILGYAYGDKAFERAAYQWAADLSIYLRHGCQGRGIGRQLYTAVEDLLRDQGYFLGYGIVTTANETSCAFHEAMGYTKQAVFPDCGWKFGQWYGTVWYEKRLRQGEPTEPPRNPC